MNDYVRMFKFFSEKSKTMQYSNVKSYPKSDLGSFFAYADPSVKKFGILIKKELWDSSAKEIYYKPSDGTWKSPADYLKLSDVVADGQSDGESDTVQENE